MSIIWKFAFSNISESYLPRLFLRKPTREKFLLRCYIGCRKKRLGKSIRWIRIQKYFLRESSKNIVKSPLGEIVVPPILFHEMIFSNWSLWENKVALRCGLTGRRYKFREVMKHSEVFAAALQNKVNLKEGDNMAIILPNCPEYPIVILAASQAGVVPTLVNPLYTPYEIKGQLEDCQTKLIVTSSAGFEKCFQVVNSMKKFIPIIVVKILKEDIIPDGAINFFELLDPSNSGSFKPVKTVQEDVVIIPFSSGTTGPPKGVLLTHKSIVSNLTQISHPEAALINPTTRFHQDKIMGILPMYHIYGLMIGTFCSLKDGCQVITLPRFEPTSFINNTFKSRVAVLYIVPPIFKFLNEKRVKKIYLRSIEFLVNAASPLITKDAYNLLEKAPHVKIVQGYGMTESSPVISHTSPKRMQKLSSIGIPLASSQIKVANIDTGEALGKGENGELRVLGPQLMKGYLNRPEETKNAFDSDGYLKTGDIVYYDDDGDFFLVERLKDLIKVKGFQVAPAELEDTLRTHNLIKDAAVVGVNDPEFGEVPKAFVILENGARLSEDDVKNFIKTKLSHYKQLRGGVVFVDDFPRNNVGKVIRKSLK